MKWSLAFISYIYSLILPLMLAVFFLILFFVLVHHNGSLRIPFNTRVFPIFVSSRHQRASGVRTWLRSCSGLSPCWWSFPGWCCVSRILLLWVWRSIIAIFHMHFRILVSLLKTSLKTQSTTISIPRSFMHSSTRCNVAPCHIHPPIAPSSLLVHPISFVNSRCFDPRWGGGWT